MNNNESSVFDFIGAWLLHTFSQVHNIVIIILLGIILFLCRNKIQYAYLSIISFLKKKIKSRKIKRIILFFVKVIASPFFTVVITIIFPYLIDCYNYQINTIVVFWMFGVIANMLCNEYINGKNKLYKYFSTSLNRIKNIHECTANKIFTTRKNLPNVVSLIVKNKGVGKELEEFYFRFDSAAEIACESIYNIIKDVTGYTDHQVTIYKRFQDKNGKKCPKKCPLKNNCEAFDRKKEWTKMIACYNQYSSKSVSFDQEHCFEYYESTKDESNNEQRKKHFYIHFFSNNKTEIEILTGKENIRTKFLFHESTRCREEKIEQYVGIPLYFIEEDSEDQLCADIKNDTRQQQHVTYGVIQIDFQEKGIIGKTEEDIKNFIDKVFNGIISYLETSLQVEEMTKSLLNYISELSNLKKAVSAEQGKEYSELVKKYNKNVLDYNELLQTHNSLREKYEKLSNDNNSLNQQANQQKMSDSND